MNTSHFVFTNDQPLAPGGWGQLAPYGLFPGILIRGDGNGSPQRERALQQITPETAAAMADRFNSPWSRLKRFFSGCPIFEGHPDLPASSSIAVPKGIILKLEARADALYAQPVFTPDGLQWLDQNPATAFSAYWSAEPHGIHQGVPVFRPLNLLSVGLTNHPNLPVKPLNAIQETSVPSTRVQSNPPALANEAVAAFINSAILDGRISFAEATALQPLFEEDFATHSASLLARTPAWKTVSASRTAGLGVRKRETTLPRLRRRELILELTRRRMESTGESYATAFAAIQSAHPALFGAAPHSTPFPESGDGLNL